MQQPQKFVNTFTGGMDHQSEDRFVQPIDYRILMNADNTGVIDAGAVKEAWGNIHIDNPWLQGGINRCIGAKADISRNSIIFFVYNSQGYHAIFNYFISKQPFANGVIERIYSVTNPAAYTDLNPNPLNFFEEQEQLITGISLVDGFLFFADYKNRSKFIDIIRANNAGKKRQFKIIFNRKALAGQPYVFTLYGPSTTLQQFSFQPAADGILSCIDAFTTTARQQTSSYYTIDGCAEYVILEMSTEGPFHITIANAVPEANPTVIAYNFYPEKENLLPVSWNEVTWQLFDRLVYTGLLPPLNVYKTDTTRTTNLVKGRVFQFKYLIQYFDNSKSVYSAVSKIAIPSQVDDAPITSDSNYIEIDFSADPVFSTPERASIIKRVEIAMNEPAIDNTWKTVKVLEQHQFIGTGMQVYNFYNDGAANPIAQSQAIKQFDALPITHTSETPVDDRIFVAGTIENYDKPCVDFKVTPKIESVNIGGYSIRGKIRIKNLFTAFDQFIFRRQYTDAGLPPSTTPFYGGYGGAFLLPGTATYVIQHAIAEYHRQYATFGGWTAYLAGTDYYDVSQQKYIGAPNQATDGIFNFTSSNAVGDTLTWVTANPNAIYSEFEIKNVPNGTYILRFSASIQCNVYNDFFTTRNYQKTSAPFFQVGGLPGTPTEPATEITITVNNGDVTIADSLIADLTQPFDENWTSLQCYISANDAAGTTITDVWNDNRIHKAVIRVGDSTGIFWFPLYTDHNGYFFTSVPDQQTTTDLIIKTIQSGQYSFTYIPGTSVIYDLVTNNPWGVTGVPDSTGRIGVLRTDSVNISSFSRSYVKGNISGQQRSNISVIPDHATPGISDANGDFTLLLYADTPYYIANGLSGNGIRNSSLYFASSPINIVVSFTLSNVLFTLNLNINNFAGTFLNLNNSFSFTNTILASLLSTMSFKGGLDTIVGLVYYDEGDRKSDVAIMPGNPTNIPFYPVLGRNLFNAGLQIEIFNEPPQWAVKYHIVRLKNMQLSRFLQWCANKIEYVDQNFVTSTFSNPNSRFAKINLDNIGTYINNLHPNSTLSYSFSKGDRIRFITNGAGAFLTTLYEYEVVRAELNDIYIEKDNNNDLTLGLANGHLFEIYTPRNNSDNDFYYEIGEGYPIATDTFNGITRRYHVGLSQNQSFGPLPSQTVTPAVITTYAGGTYKRLRQIPAADNTRLITALVDDASVSDFYASQADGTGRPNTLNPAFVRVNRPTAIRFSNIYYASTQINGLRNYEALNDKQLDLEYGLIRYLVLVNNSVLKVLCHNSFLLSMYINQNTLRTATGSNLVSYSDDVLAKSQEARRSFGTQNPESVTLNDEGDLMAYDEAQGVHWRSSGNDIVIISNYKLKPTFNRLSQSRRVFPASLRLAPAVYHIYKDEMIISFKGISPPPPKPATGTFLIPYFDTTLPNDSASYVKVSVNPVNQILFQSELTSNTLYPNIAQIVSEGINKNTLSTGWHASVSPLGYLQITAPASYPYPNAAIVIAVSFLNAEGNPQTITFTFNLNNPIPPSAEEYQPGFNAQTLSFTKTKNVWPVYYEYFPEMFGFNRNNFVSFVAGSLFLHSEKAPPNTWYGVYYPVKLSYVVNPDFGKVKIFQATEVNINNNDTFFPVIKIPPDELSPLGMETEIVKDKMQNVQGKLYADIPMDKNTPGFTSVQEAWVDGQNMTGQVLLPTLVNDGNKKFKLVDIKTIYINSELS